MSGGEEQYLAFAKQWVNPNWITDSFTYSEYPGSRIVFQWIVGHILHWINFEWSTLLFRGLNFLLYAHAISLLFRKLELNWLHTWIIIQTYVIVNQSFFASSWMLISFEPKTIAYALAIYALYFYLESKYYRSFILLGIASYFHVLVGGWLILYLCIHQFLFKRNLKHSAIFGLTSLIVSFPILWYIYQGIQSADSIHSTTVSANHIYAYYRLHHHNGLFDSLDYFKATHLAGLIQMILALLLFLIIYRFINPLFQKLFEISFVIGGIIIFYLIIAFIDHAYLHESGDWGLITYPFRGNVLIKFFLIIVLGKWIGDWIQTARKNAKLRQLILLLFSVFTVIQGINNVKRNLRYPGNEDYRKLVAHIEQNSSDTVVITSIGLSEEEQYRLGRLARREPFVEYKFVPARTSKIFEWYRRCLIFDEWQKMNQLELLYNEGIDLVVTKTKLQIESHYLEEAFGSYYIYTNYQNKE